MPATVKRSLSATPDEADIVTPPTSDGDDIKIPSKKTKVAPKSPKSPSKSPKRVKGADDGEKKGSTPRSWTAEEDAIFIELLEGLAKDGLWGKIKEDGRLEYRGNPGVRAHLTAIINKIKKA